MMAPCRPIQPILPSRQYRDNSLTKTIVITGAGDGLGKALARRFCADGDRVFILGRTEATLRAAADEFGERCVPVTCDISDSASVRHAFGLIAQQTARIDVLINNAAIYAPFELNEVTDEQVMSQINTNIAGPVFVAREALGAMEAGAHIINVSSESVKLPVPMMWLYAATKAALERIGDGWRRELRPRGIRVTTVRAGKMFGENKTTSGWDTEVTMRFAAACAAAGMPMMEQPLSQFQSLPDIFRLIVDAAPDINLDHITLGARRAD